MNKNEILITGFTPFLNNSINPSEEVARLLEKEGYKSLIVDTSYRDVDAKITKEFIESNNIKFIISIGLASSRKTISVERFAYNERSIKTKDNDGYLPTNPIIDVSKNDCYKTNLDLETLVKCFKNENVVISNDAGRYLCNYIYFKDLNLLDGNALFVHLPLCKSKIEIDDAKSICETIIKFIEKN